MPLQTTVIGSFPKPEYLDLPDWFKSGAGAGSTEATKTYSKLLSERSLGEQAKLEADIMRATKEVIDIQGECGVNIVTDGEIRRENYIHYLCRFIEGIDFENLTDTSCRNGAYVASLPTIRSKVSWRGPSDVAAEWKKAQDVAQMPVKYTLPGPLTIIGTLNNAFYENEKDLAEDLAAIVGNLVKELSQAGCKQIQIDEPLFARQPQKALAYGVSLLDACFRNAADDCFKTMHMCCGYPEYLDQEGYKKAEPSVYFQLAEAVDNTCIDAVSLEDAHCHNDLTLLEKFKTTTVILGSVKIASSKVESVEEIKERLEQALDHIPADRLIVAPDCGLAFLPLPILKSKLINMCTAAKACGCKRLKTDSDN
nr:B12-independent methionine synthase 2 [Karlodinium veneficum]